MSGTKQAGGAKFRSAPAPISERPRVLVVEDNRRLAIALRTALSQLGVSVVIAEDASDCERKVQTESPELILLDTTLPSASGFAVCNRLHATYGGAIILLLESASDLDNQFGLQLGAAFCIPKPVVMSELVAKVKTVLGLTDEFCVPKEEVCIAGELTLYPARFELHAPGRRVDLTQHELKLLRWLMQHSNTVVSRKAIVRHMWPEEERVEHTRVSEMMRRIRKKLEVDPHHPKYLRGIQTGHGGYALFV